MREKKNQELYDEALEAVNKLFSDLSVSKEKALDNLENLIVEIESMIDESLEKEEKP